MAFRRPDVVVLGLPRGGVSVAYEVATALGAPIDIVLSRKLVVPDRPWLIFGVLGEGGIRITDRDIGDRASISDIERERITRDQRERLRLSVVRYRLGVPHLPLAGMIAVIVDDGIATGATANLACHIARARGAGQVVFATPVGSGRPVRALTAVADHVICLEIPQLSGPIRPWYADFTEVTDGEACALLDRANENLFTPSLVAAVPLTS